MASYYIFHASGFALVVINILYAPAMLVIIVFHFVVTDFTPIVEPGITLEYALLAVALLAQLLVYFVVVIAVRLLYRRIRKRA